MSQYMYVLPFLFSISIAAAHATGVADPGGAAADDMFATRAPYASGAAPATPADEEPQGGNSGAAAGTASKAVMKGVNMGATVAPNSCGTDFGSAGGACDDYNERTVAPPSGKKMRKATSQMDGANLINDEIQEAVRTSFKGARACGQAATDCIRSCGNAGDKRAGQCQAKKDKAYAKHRDFKKEAEKQSGGYQGYQDTAGGRPRDGEDNNNNNDKPNYNPSSIPPGQTSGPPPSQAQTGPKDNQPEKTAEQKKEERREAKAEQRKNDRINALGQAFMALNQKAPLQAALQERTPESHAEAKAAMAAAEKASPAKEAQEDNDDPVAARTGFDALAKKNLAARKALATAMGIQSKNIAAAGSPMRAMAATVTGGQGSVFPTGPTGFGAAGMGGGAQLDPVVDIPRPSDLPKNFRLEAPSAGGGGGGGGSMQSASRSKPKSLDDEKPREQNSDDDDSADAPARGVASIQQSPFQIRERNANLFNVVSTAFRSRCAQGRLLDCAEHLPKQ